MSDDEILAAYRFLASREGVFCEPSSAAGVALARSTVGTIDATLPAPTPKAGVPEAYAARTFACEPVATTRSHRRMSSAVDSLVTGAGRICTRSRGATIRSSC